MNKVVELTEPYNGIPEGSVFIVLSETKLKYNVLWCSMLGSYKMKVPKSVCKIKERK